LIELDGCFSRFKKQGREVERFALDFDLVVFDETGFEFILSIDVDDVDEKVRPDEGKRVFDFDGDLDTSFFEMLSGHCEKDGLEHGCVGGCYGAVMAPAGKVFE